MSVQIEEIEYWADWPNPRDTDFDVRAKSNQAWVSAEGDLVPANQSRVVGTGTITARRPTIPSIILPATSAGIDRQDALWTVTLHRTGKADVIYTVLERFPLNVSFEPAATWGEISLFKNNGNNHIWRDTQGFSRTDALALINSRLLATLVNASAVVKGNTLLSVDPDVPTIPRAWGVNDRALGFYISKFATLSDALTSISSTKARLYIDSNITVSNSPTIPDNVTLIYAGGIISTTSGQNLAVNGYLDCPDAQFFAGAGTVTLGANAALMGVRAAWFGVTNTTNNSADSQAGIQKAINACPNGGAVILPQGWTLSIRSKLTMNGRNGIRLIGGLSANPASPYAGTFTILQWNGAANGKMLDMINSNSCVVQGIKFDMVGLTPANCAEIGINASADYTATLVNASIGAGSNVLDFTTLTNVGVLVAADTNGDNIMVGRTITVPGAGPAGADLVTTITSVPDGTAPGDITLAATASVSVSGVSATITPHETSGNSSSSHTFRGCQFNWSGALNARASRCGLRVDYASNQNSERMTVDDCVAFANGPQTADSLNYGTAFQFGSNIQLGDAVSAGGSNLLNIKLRDVYWYGVSRGVKAACSVDIINGESNFACIDIHTTGGCYVQGFYSEFQRQFVKSRTQVTLVNCRPRHGARNTSFAIVEMEASGNLFCLNTDFYSGVQETGQPSVLATSGDSSCVLFGCTMADLAAGDPDLSSFTQGGLTFANFGNRMYLSGVAFAPPVVAFAALANYGHKNGVTVYCSNGTPGSNPLTGGGTGCLAVRQNGAWVAAS